MKVAIRESTLTAIGDAIREKTDTTDLLAPGAMPAAIRSITTGEGSGELPAVEPIVVSSVAWDEEFGVFAGPVSSKYVELFGDTITTDHLCNCRYMFYDYRNESVPFALNFYPGEQVHLDCMFSHSRIKTLPTFGDNTSTVRFTGGSHMFERSQIEYIPDEFAANWDSTSGILANEAFRCCYKLRSISPIFLNKIKPAHYSSLFEGCYSLEEINGLGVYTETNGLNNKFTDTFNQCSKLKNFTFALDGTIPYKVSWGNSVIDMTQYVGFEEINTFNPNDYNYPLEKRVTDDATYQALKDDPEYWTTDPEYSRYNKQSALLTIHSLPDASEYISSFNNNNQYTNTIKFVGNAGAKTDGGAINTLTSTQIAIAAAKGWTVSFT